MCISDWRCWISCISDEYDRVCSGDVLEPHGVSFLARQLCTPADEVGLGCHASEETADFSIFGKCLVKLLYRKVIRGCPAVTTRYERIIVQAVLQVSLGIGWILPKRRYGRFSDLHVCFDVYAMDEKLAMISDLMKSFVGSQAYIDPQIHLKSLK